MWKAGIALLWDVWGARAREVSGIILKEWNVQCVERDRSNQCVFCNILREKIQMNENCFLSAPQTYLDDVIGSLEPSLQIVSECLKAIVGYFAPFFPFFFFSVS